MAVGRWETDKTTERKRFAGQLETLSRPLFPSVRFGGYLFRTQHVQERQIV